MDSSAEDWSKFEVSENSTRRSTPWLALPSSGSSTPAAVTSSSRASQDPPEVGSSFRLRQLVVRYQNPAVHVQEFLTRLRGSASRCNFVENCTAAGCDSEVSYADSIIRFKLIAGLSEAKIKEDILSAEDRSLDETLKAIEAKENGKLVGVSEASKAAAVTTGAQPRNCDYCGRTCGSSASVSRSSREKNCTAWGKVCSNCKQKGHFSAVCQKERGDSDRAGQQ